MLITDTRPRQPGSALPQLHGSQCLSWQWSVINTPQSSTATPIQRQLLLRSGLTTTLPASLYFLSYSNSATGFYDQTYSEQPNYKQFRPASGSAPSAFCSADYRLQWNVVAYISRQCPMFISDQATREATDRLWLFVFLGFFFHAPVIQSCVRIQSQVVGI